MSKTEVSGKQVKDGSIELVDLSSALADTINAKAEATDVTALDTRVTAVEADLSTLQSAGVPNLSDLGQVSITSPSNGQVLKYNGIGWANAADSTFSGSYTDLTNKPTIPSALDDLSDVTISSPSNDQVLKYNGTAWVNSAAPAAGATDLDGLSDVAVTSAAKGQFIVHNGTQFVNSNTIEASGAAVKPLIVKGAASQTANLFEAQSSGGTAYITMNVDESFATAGQTGALYVQAPNNNRRALVLRASGAPNFSTFEVQNSAGSTVMTVNHAGTIGLPAWNISGASFFNIATSAGTSLFSMSGNGQVGLNYGTTFDESSQLSIVLRGSQGNRKGISVRQGAAGQTGNFFEALNSAGTVLASVGPNGDAFFTSSSASGIPLSISRPASATGHAFVVRDSSGNRLFAVMNNGAATSPIAGLGGAIEIGSSVYNMATLGYHTSSNSLRVVSPSDTVLGLQSADGGAGVYTMIFARDTTALGWTITPSNSVFPSHVNIAAKLGVNLSAGTAPGGASHINTGAAATKGLIVQAAASQTANLFEAQNSSGTALTLIQSNGTLHAVRYTETAANAFSTSLAPSSGTLTVDSSLGNAVLGALSASVTTWAFTNVPAENSKVTTVSAVIAGNTSFTYGSACSVNGSAVATGVQWFGGTAPTPSASTDVLTFVIIRDSAGTIRVLGSAQTVDSVIGSASAGIDGAGSANYLSKWTDANTIANSAIYESAGNVGIGTTSPSGSLDIQGTGGNFLQHRFSANGNFPQHVFRKSRGATVGTNTIVQAGDGLGGVYFQGANGTGYTDAAGITCEVDTTPGASNDMPGRLLFYTTADGSGTPTERMRIDSAGRVGIGMSASSDDILAISVNNASLTGKVVRTTSTGTALTTHYAFKNGNGDVGFINTSGSGTTFQTTSDYRLKENIVPISNALKRLELLNPCRFNFKADPSTTVDGFIAHELQEVIPDAVSGQKDEIKEDGSIKPQAVDYSRLTPLLAAALKELSAKVDALQAEKEALEARLAALENN